MEVFVKVIAENLLAGERCRYLLHYICGYKRWKTFVRTTSTTETEEEHWLHQTGSRTRRKGRLKSKEMAEVLTLSKPWSI